MHRNKLYLGGAVLAVTLMTAVGAGVAMAETENSSPSKLAQAIADKFDLNAEDVQGVMNEHKEVRHQEMQQQVDEKLTQAVEDGKLTQAQKDELVRRMEEMKAGKLDLSEMSDSERQAKLEEMKNKHQEFRTWLESEGIELKEILGRDGRLQGFGHRLVR